MLVFGLELITRGEAHHGDANPATEERRTNLGLGECSMATTLATVWSLLLPFDDCMLFLTRL